MLSSCNVFYCHSYSIKFSHLHCSLRAALIQLQQRRVFQNVFFSVTLGISGGWLLVILFVLTSTICPPWFNYKRDLWLPPGFVIDHVVDIDD